MNHPQIPQPFARDKWDILENSVDPREWCQRKMKLLEEIIGVVKDIIFFFLMRTAWEKIILQPAEMAGCLLFPGRMEKNWRWVKYQWCCLPARQKSIYPEEVSISIEAIKSLFYNSGLSISHVKTAAALLKTLICRWDRTSGNMLYFQGKE